MALLGWARAGPDFCRIQLLYIFNVETFIVCLTDDILCKINPTQTLSYFLQYFPISRSTLGPTGF